MQSEVVIRPRQGPDHLLHMWMDGQFQAPAICRPGGMRVSLWVQQRKWRPKAGNLERQALGRGAARKSCYCCWSAARGLLPRSHPQGWAFPGRSVYACTRARPRAGLASQEHQTVEGLNEMGQKPARYSSQVLKLGF